jgi:hypothetical protein
MDPVKIYIEDILAISDKPRLAPGDDKILQKAAKDWAEREKVIRASFPDGMHPDTFQSAIRTQAAVSTGTHYLVRFQSPNLVPDHAIIDNHSG